MTHQPGSSRFALNVKFLAIRLIAISVSVIPFKAFLLNSLGSVVGLFLMLLRIGQWKAIKWFARHTGSPLPALLYIVKYFVQQGRDGVWGYVFCEAPYALDKYIIMQNMEAVEHALEGRKGAIVLAAHYGPELYTYMLNRMHFNVKTLADKKFVMQLHDAETLVLEPLRSKRIMFLNKSGVLLVSREEEKYLFDHVKNGGMVKMEIDYPGPSRNTGTAPFLGISIRPHLFPFRLALKYDIPVFFCFFNKNKSGAYIMNFIPSGEYSTPEEGFRQYLSSLQAQIEECPFMWGMIPLFFEWL